MGPVIGRHPSAACAGTLLLLWFLAGPVSAGTLAGRVISVHDGDTVTVQVQGGQRFKIRLAQIDAPEIDQPFGLQSKQSLVAMVLGKSVQVEEEAVDRYGRTVGTMFVDGLNVSREQLGRGMAWAYRRYLHDQALLQVEQSARQARLGLWAEANPTPPWEHRPCGGKRYCSEMSSCEEAEFYFNRCGLSRLDRDNDGIPCESLCGK